MRTLLDPSSFLVVSLSVRLDEPTSTTGHPLFNGGKPVPREQIGNRRMRFSDDQRRRLAPERGQSVGDSSMKSPPSSLPKRCWLGIKSLAGVVLFTICV